ncbi:hypothetical protein M0804_000495 [Polistes exclamans]|nr:hypothetical protein M0804_000495 [Polistes exclamans]
MVWGRSCNFLNKRANSRQIDIEICSKRKDIIVDWVELSWVRVGIVVVILTMDVVLVMTTVTVTLTVTVTVSSNFHKQTEPKRRNDENCGQEK